MLLKIRKLALKVVVVTSWLTNDIILREIIVYFRVNFGLADGVVVCVKDKF